MLVVNVEFQGRARCRACRTDDPALALGDLVLVEADGRAMCGAVTRVPLEEPWPPEADLPRVVGRAAVADEEREAQHQRQRDEWLEIARQQVEAHQLPMRLLRAELAPAGRKVTFQFVADGRVDFRDLVRDLARRLRARVELRQIGVRDAAFFQGGVGHCGQPFCCASWLSGFAPVSMRMAKAQGLPLNPTKISGQCGRLMCCLRYELPVDAAPPAEPDEPSGS